MVFTRLRGLPMVRGWHSKQWRPAEVREQTRSRSRPSKSSTQTAAPTSLELMEPSAHRMTSAHCYRAGRPTAARWHFLTMCPIRKARSSSACTTSIIEPLIRYAALRSRNRLQRAPTGSDWRHERIARRTQRCLLAAEMAAREMGGLSLADALLLCELLANTDPARYERAALRWLERFIDERLPPLTEVALAASALAELRHGQRNTGVEALKRLARQS
jgi:hypothetical protein